MSTAFAAAPSTELAIEARGLVKRYGELTAVAGLDLRVRRGECFGLLGPNGAGKSSTLRMLQAVSAPSGGSLRVLGLDPVREGKRLRARLGVCPQDDNLDPDLTVFDNLLVYGSYFPQAARATRERAERLLDFVALRDKRDARVPELSGGMKRRLTLARALINEPELVLLDEPTTGLDPQARHLVWQKLRELRERGVTLLLTTHYMDEAERLCDRLCIVDGGRVLAEGAPAALIAEHVGAEVAELEIPEARERELYEGLGEVRGERAGDQLYFTLDRGAALGDELSQRARRLGCRCVLRRATLEDVFLRLTGRELGE